MTRRPAPAPRRSSALAVAHALAAALLAAHAAAPAAGAQLPVRARAKPTLTVGGERFKDLNANGRLDRYEDWRLPVAARVSDLVGRMTVEEKAGMLLINTLNAEAGGRLSDRGVEMIQAERMTRFVFRNTVTPSPEPPAPGGRGGGMGGAQVTAYEAAQFTNLVQEVAEGTRLGIPVVFKSNARNHHERDARWGISVASGAFSEWPKEPGLAATRDTALVAEFGRIMAREWTAIGLRGMYGYMGDLATEPRWHRVHETFGEDADLASTIVGTLVRTIQGPRLGPGSVALTMKHFPGLRFVTDREADARRRRSLQLLHRPQLGGQRAARAVSDGPVRRAATPRGRRRRGARRAGRTARRAPPGARAPAPRRARPGPPAPPPGARPPSRRA